jgi:tRNA1(Val) A37 N6-methylase TrmN6
MQFVYPTKEKNAKLVMVYARLNSKSLTNILPPLIVFDKNNNFTKQVQDIYTYNNTYSIKVEFDNI